MGRNRKGSVTLAAGLLLLSMVLGGARLPTQGRATARAVLLRSGMPGSPVHSVRPPLRPVWRVRGRTFGAARPDELTFAVRCRVHLAAAMRECLSRCRATAWPSRTPLLRTIPLTGAEVIAVDEQTDRVFVTRGVGDTGLVSVLDARSGALLRTVKVGTDPLVVAVDAPARRVFVSGRQGVSVLDARSGVVLHAVPLVGGAGQMAVAEGVGHVFVTAAIRASGSAVVSMLDERSGTVLHVTRVGVGSDVLAVAQHVGRVFVSTYDAARVSMLDARTGTVLRIIRVGQGPTAAAVDESTGHVFVVNYGSSNVSMLDARTGVVLRTTAVNSSPSHLGVDAQTGRIFVPTLYTIDVLDARSGVLVHSLNASVLSAPVANPRTGHVLELLVSPLNSQGNPTTPPLLAALDGRTGVVRQRVVVSDVHSYGLVNLVAVDGRTSRVFVVQDYGVGMFDAAHL